MTFSAIFFAIFHLLFLVNLSVTVDCYYHYQRNIPNGNHVQFEGFAWSGVGHLRRGGTGVLNPFGEDFAASGFEWTKELCAMDSDLDGRTNGEELGDPNCNWSLSNQVVERTAFITHPGLADDAYQQCFQGDTVGDRCHASSLTHANTNSRDSSNSVDDSDGNNDIGKNGENVKTMDLTMKGFLIPNFKTDFYACASFSLNLSSKYHITQIAPIVDTHNMLHHMLLYICPNLLTQFENGAKCFLSVPTECNRYLWAWAMGGTEYCLPSEAGFPIGFDSKDASVRNFLLVQFHYSNPHHIRNTLDFSGVRITYTETLRRYDAITISPNSVWGTKWCVPPGVESHVIETRLKVHCRLNVFSVYQHMHLIGFAIDWQVFNSRGEKKDGYRVYSSVFDFAAQSVVNVRMMELQPDDILQTRCFYDSTDRDFITERGEGTIDEMCLSLFSFYPYKPQCLELITDNPNHVQPIISPYLLNLPSSNEKYPSCPFKKTTFECALDEDCQAQAINKYCNVSRMCDAKPIHHQHVVMNDMK